MAMFCNSFKKRTPCIMSRNSMALLLWSSLVNLLILALSESLPLNFPAPIHNANLNPDSVLSPKSDSCSCHRNYEYWVRVAYDVQTVLREKKLPEIFAESVGTESDSRVKFQKKFEEIKLLIDRVTGKGGCEGEKKRPTESTHSKVRPAPVDSIMFNEEEKNGWLEAGFGSDCAPGQAALALMCGLKSLIRVEDSEPDLESAAKYYQLANYQLPLFAPCIERGMWGFSSTEFIDNYRRIMVVLQELGYEYMPRESESSDSGDSESPSASDSESRRTTLVPKRVKISVTPRVMKRVMWRPREHMFSDANVIGDHLGAEDASESSKLRLPMSAAYSATKKSDFTVEASYPSEETAVEQTCSNILDMEADSEISEVPSSLPKLSRHCSAEKKSRFRYLSHSRCSTVIENACVLGDKIYAFGVQPSPRIQEWDEDYEVGEMVDHEASDEASESSPKSFNLRTCGEFGNSHFTDIVFVNDKRDRQLMCNNATEHYTDTLFVSTGMLAGVSEGNPYHLLHLTIPAYWQLQSRHYGVCAPPKSVDVRYQFLTPDQAQKMNHFWRVITGQYKSEKQPLDFSQLLHMYSQSSFWWGGLAGNPPLPLGQDLKPRCYKRIVFGRESMRTGPGGYVDQKVFRFSVDRIHKQFGTNSKSTQRRRDLKTNLSGSSREKIQIDDRVSLDSQLEEFSRKLVSPRVNNINSSARFNKEAGPRCSFFTEFACSRTWPQVMDRKAGLFVNPDRLEFEDLLTDVEVHHKNTLFRFGAVAEPSSTSNPTNSKTPCLNVTIVQRAAKAKRSFENLREVLEFFKESRDTEHHVASHQVQIQCLSVLVTYLETLQPLAQYRLASESNVWIGATGAANAWSVFMPRGGVLLDTFPPLNGFCDPGWNRNAVTHFGGLSRLAANGSLHHHCEVHKSDGGETKYQVIKARLNANGGLWHNQNIHLDINKFKKTWKEVEGKVLQNEN